MIPLKTEIFPLELLDFQAKSLTRLSQLLGKQLEKVSTLRPEMLYELITEMKSILEGQTEFSKIAASARKFQTHLHITHSDPNILNLPWRLVTKDLPLLFLTKGKPIEGELPILKADNPPLKILVMVSSPEDSEYDGLLSYEEEEDQIIKAFEPLFDSGQVQIDFTDDGSPENLTEKLLTNRYHIVHFSGHGVYRDGMGYLALEDHQTMNQRLVEAKDFAQVFQRKPQNIPTLIVLNSCQTSKGGMELGMQSVADELLLKGLPAVIAMSVSVTDYFATYFASALYQFMAMKESLFQAFQKAIAKTKQHEIDRNPRFAPSQYLIPQLFVSKQIQQLVDFKKTDKNLKYEAWKFVSGKESLQREKRTNYQFVGRRHDRKLIFQSLAKNSSVLIKGQGGVGKTAMAEHILQRLVAKDTRVYPFIFNETNAKLDTALKKVKEFFSLKNLEKIVEEAENRHSDNEFEQLFWLSSKLKESCNPFFIFDNFESFQSGKGKDLKPEHFDLKKILKTLFKEKIPIIITCRYSVVECPNIPTFNLNQVSNNDFLKKALQLFIKELPKKMQKSELSLLEGEKDHLTFLRVINWLHGTFGGNYRSLEFFDMLYLKKVSQTKDKTKLIEILQTLTDFKSEYINTTIETRQQMSKNLLFGELFKLLSEDAKIAFRLLGHFRVPVLVTALQMQRHDLDHPKLLDNLLELTLIERHNSLEHPALVYYYVTPLIKDLLIANFKGEDDISSEEILRQSLQIQSEITKENINKIIGIKQFSKVMYQNIYERGNEIKFSVEMGGKYHRWVYKEVKRRERYELFEAFEFLKRTDNTHFLNDLGYDLCAYFYSNSQFNYAVQVGFEVYSIEQDNTKWQILMQMGAALIHIGNPDLALYFFEICVEKKQIKEDLKRLGELYNNISQAYRLKGDYPKTIEYLERALKVLSQTELSSIRATILNNLATMAQTTDEHEKALDYLKQALEIQEELQDYENQSTTLNNISIFYFTQQKFDIALKYLQKSFSLCEKFNDLHGKGAVLDNIGRIFIEKGNSEEALEYFQETLGIRQKIGDKEGEGTTLNNIGNIYMSLGENEIALKYFQEALQTQKLIENEKTIIVFLQNIGRVYRQLKDYENALINLESALDASKRVGDKQSIAYTMHSIAVISYEKGDFERFFEYEWNSYQIIVKTNDRHAICNIGKTLGDVLCQFRNFEFGLPILEKSYIISFYNDFKFTKELAFLIKKYKSQLK